MAISVTYADGNAGIGGVLTIAGSAAGSTNNVYVSEFVGYNVNRAFRLLGSRIGDGVINYVVTQSGGFLVCVVNEATTVTFSTPKVFRAGDGVSAVHWRVCVALREMIIGMALPGLSTNPDAHVITKVGAKIQDVLDTDHKCVFYIPTQEGLSYMDNTYDSVEYPVNVVITRKSGQELVGGLADLLKARMLTHELFAAIPIPDLPFIHTVDYRPGVINDASQWLNGYDVSVITLVALTEVSGGIL